MNPVHSAKFKSVNPVAFDRKIKANSLVGTITNFVVKKPLRPNALDDHQARRIRERNGGIKRVSVLNY
jgi:hypothetical protein